MSDDESEVSLNTHIRNLLQDYAFKHLTVDHVQFSESLVSEILPKILNPIPTHEPGLIFRSTDPFETLKTKLNLGSLPAYDEVLQSSSEALELLKSTLLPSNSRLRSNTVWEEEDNFDYEKMPHRPMTPLLSRESKRKTPVIGKSPKHMPLSATLSLHNITHVPDESMPEGELLKLDDYMDAKLTIDASTHAALIEYQKCIPFLSRPNPRTFSKHAVEFLRSQSPKYEAALRPISLPLFCREQQARASKRDAGSNILGPLKFVPVNVEEFEPDIAKENMVIVDGWATIASSASTPSLSSGRSEEDELEDDNEIWRPSSSDGIPAVIEVFERSKMEEPIFPRSERPRNGKAEAEKDEDKSLTDFLTKRIAPTISADINTVLEPDDDVVVRTRSSPAPMSLVSLSMLGQPPSESEVSSAQFSETRASEDDLSKDIRRIIGGKLGLDSKVSGAFQDIIMHERLDEKESMFMDVPILSPPNEHFRNAARLMEGGIVPPNISEKVSGLKSLNIELSWRPFTFGAKIPTHAELAGVDSLFTTDTDKYLSDDIESEVNQAAVKDLLNELSISQDIGSSTKASNSNCLFSELGFRFMKDPVSDTDSRCFHTRFDPNRDFDDVQAILLPRSERRALASNQQPNNYDGDPFNKLFDYDNSASYETSDYSSAITPDFEPRLWEGHTSEDDGELAVAHDHVTSIPVSREQLEEAYITYQDGNEPDDIRDWKRRRLSNAELDALCTANIESQSMELTVDPKELAFTRAIDASHENQLGYDRAMTEPFERSQTDFFLSQTLSLHEDSISQEAFLLDGTFAIPGGTENGNIAFHPESITPFIAEFTESANNYPTHPSELQSNNIVISSSNHQQARISETPVRGYSPIPPQQPLPVSLLTQPVENTRHSLNERSIQRLSPSLPLLCDDYSLSRFLGLRRKGTVMTFPSPTRSDRRPQPIAALTTVSNEDSSLTQVYHSVPPDLLADTRALMIPDSWQLPTTEHSYLVSVDFIQQRALARILESPTCLARLVHRDNINPLPPSNTPAASNLQYSADISIITSPHSGVVLFSLVALPSQTTYKALLDALAAHSWRFSRVLLMLLAFPRSDLVRATNVNLDERNRLDKPSSYSPPVLKAARRIKRDLGLREGTGEKRAGSIVELCFADDVEQAATLVRVFADVDLRDNIVDYAPYLTEDEQEGEVDLAEVASMNIFCSALILRCCTLGEFLEMAPEKRTEGLADLIGQERIEHVNAVLSKRMQVIGMDLPSSSETLSSLSE